MMNFKIQLQDPSEIKKAAPRPVRNKKTPPRSMTAVFRTDRPWVFEPVVFFGSSTRQLPVLGTLGRLIGETSY